MMALKRSQLVAMNQHYRRYSLDYFLSCQQRLGVEQIELWCGAAHFWLDHEGYGDVPALQEKLRAHGVRVVSVTAPSIAYQYQYASQEPEHLERSFCYFSNAIRLAARLGADRVVVNSGWGYDGEAEGPLWDRCRRHLTRLCHVAGEEGILLVMESLRRDESNLVYSLERARRMFREVDHPQLKMMVDNIATGAAGETLDDWFDAFGADLIHMHFLDGDPWVHSVWGDGNTSLSRQIETLRRRGFTGYLVQEVADERYFTDPYAADRRNLRVLNRFIEGPEPPADGVFPGASAQK